jgi:transcriptional regulator with XRE-family HTH domain
MCDNRTVELAHEARPVNYEAERLKVIRAGQNLTQQQLADRSGIDREKIAKIETGARRMSATDAAYLAQGLGVRADDLIGRPRADVRWRLEPAHRRDAEQAELTTVARWFEDFVDDASYLERRARRYGVE